MTLTKPQRTAIVTIVSNNYLHFARTMLQSAKQHHPEYGLYCVIVDRDLSHIAAHSSEFEAISFEKLGLPLGEEFLFQYNILELNTAVKPWAIEYLFERGHENVIYVDPDIYFYERMRDVEHLLSANMDIVLTPHLLAPVTDDKQPRELDIRRAGTYNFGFCALRDTTNTRKFLGWWQSKLTRDCVNDADRGLFVDQSWIDLVPGLFENVGILRHKGYNVAYWNIAQRQLIKHDERGYFIDHEPLVFFHFSGLDPSNPETFSKHQTRFTLSTVGLARDLVDVYVKAVIANGYHHFGKLEYGFGRFSNKEKIPDIFRNLYRLSSPLRERMGTQPFTCCYVMCDLWPEISIDGISPTNAMMALWNVRHDVRSEFPLNSASSIIAYYRWFITFPPASEHYSATVISYHRAALKRLEKQITPGVDRSTALKAMTWPGKEQRAHHLYKHLLNRTPDKSGLLVYSEMCKTDAGFLRAWGEIGLSEESKKKRFLWLRMLKALLITICKVDRRNAENADKSVSDQKELNGRIFPGIFPVEADVATNGVWVTDRVTLAVDARPGDRITLSGTYFPELIEKQHGSGESTIRFLLGNEEIYAAQLTAPGDFTIEYVVPDSRIFTVTNLTLESSKVFMPKHIGQSDDERTLAWRMKLLSVGDKLVFDCMREETYPISAVAAATSGAPDAGLAKLAYSGFFQADADSEELGVWASANIVVPIVPIQGEKIHLHGAYFSDWIAKQTGTCESTLCFFIGDKEVHRVTLSESGDFTVDFALPKLDEYDGASLHIQCSKTFVRQNIGEGNDDRILSWRIKTLKAGRITVFDCSRQNVATSNRRFVPRMTHAPNYAGSRVKLFAFYLPQFSPFPTDHVPWCDKIVDWADVSNAMPQYADHHQPQLPVELGFYDYRSAGVLQHQVALAKQYGIAGFCFHHFWSGGKASTDQPMNRFLADASLDINFCISLTNNQSGQFPNDATRTAQTFREDDIALIDSLASAFADARYRRIDQKPILIVSNVLSLPDAAASVSRWRARASQLGFPDLYLIASVPDDTVGYCITAFDAVIAIPPAGCTGPKQDMTSKIISVTPRFSGRVYDYCDLADHRDDLAEPGLASFEAVMPSWDNEVLAPMAGTSFLSATPEEYANWLSKAIVITSQRRAEVQLVFINAWNAWSEGAHLESDQRYGYGYLHATASVLLNHSVAQSEEAIRLINESFSKRSDTVVIAHIYYEDLIDSIFDPYLTVARENCDLIVSVMQHVSLASIRKIKDKFENCFILQTANCGRDIRPFIIALRKAHELGYLYGCKLHTKKSPQLIEGEKWRTELLDVLLPSPDSIETIIQRFKSRPALGLQASRHSLCDLSEASAHFGNTKWLNELLARMGQEKMIGNYASLFPAGSMFWFRVAALPQLLEDKIVSLDEFELEAGQLDGTLAHAIERIVVLIPTCNGFEIDTLD